MIQVAKKGFYITTPLYYLNSTPHVGTAYATISADVIARWNRIAGNDVLFLTGTDEHGEKVKQAADKNGKKVEDFVDELSNKFRKTWDRLDISYDDFIRTTEERHEKVVEQFVELAEKNGDIYKGQYEGKYCVGCESFKTDTELVDGKCPDHGKEPESRKEDTYFFKLSKYENKLLEFYEKNPDFLSPIQADEIKNRVKEGLKDLSITRAKLDWGIPFPLDKKHVTYVWFDALVNYVSALGGKDSKEFKKFWPADIHVIGKEINWFHSVIWPAMLFSVGIEPPKRVFVHGWLLVDGKKISKSLGNAIDPVAISEKYSSDALRYYLLKEAPFGDDGNFSEKKLIERINGELVADLGNLVYRALTLTKKFDGDISGEPDGYPIEEKVKKISALMEGYKLTQALDEVWEIIRDANKYINENEPWKLSGKELSNVLYNLVERIRMATILVYPFLPASAESTFKQLGVEHQTLKNCKFSKKIGKLERGDYLFEKIEV